MLAASGRRRTSRAARRRRPTRFSRGEPKRSGAGVPVGRRRPLRSSRRNFRFRPGKPAWTFSAPPAPRPGRTGRRRRGPFFRVDARAIGLAVPTVLPRPGARTRAPAGRGAGGVRSPRARTSADADRALAATAAGRLAKSRAEDAKRSRRSQGRLRPLSATETRSLRGPRTRSPPARQRRRARPRRRRDDQSSTQAPLQPPGFRRRSPGGAPPEENLSDAGTTRARRAPVRAGPDGGRGGQPGGRGRDSPARGTAPLAASCSPAFGGVSGKIDARPIRRGAARRRRSAPEEGSRGARHGRERTPGAHPPGEAGETSPSGISPRGHPPARRALPPATSEASRSGNADAGISLRGCPPWKNYGGNIPTALIFEMAHDRSRRGRHVGASGPSGKRSGKIGAETVRGARRHPQLLVDPTTNLGLAPAAVLERAAAARNRTRRARLGHDLACAKQPLPISTPVSRHGGGRPARLQVSPGPGKIEETSRGPTAPAPAPIRKPRQEADRLASSRNRELRRAVASFALSVSRRPREGQGRLSSDRQRARRRGARPVAPSLPVATGGIVRPPPAEVRGRPGNVQAIVRQSACARRKSRGRRRVRPADARAARLSAHRPQKRFRTAFFSDPATTCGSGRHAYVSSSTSSAAILMALPAAYNAGPGRIGGFLREHPRAFGRRGLNAGVGTARLHPPGLSIRIVPGAVPRQTVASPRVARAASRGVGDEKIVLVCSAGETRGSPCSRKNAEATPEPTFRAWGRESARRQRAGRSSPAAQPRHGDLVDRATEARPGRSIPEIRICADSPRRQDRASPARRSPARPGAGCPLSPPLTRRRQRRVAAPRSVHPVST